MPLLKTSFICIALLLAQAAQSQMTRMEKFNKMVEDAETDSARIELINFKIEYYLDLNVDSALRIAHENIAASRKADYMRGVASGYLYCVSGHVYKGEYGVAKNYLDTAKQIVYSMNDSAYIHRYYAQYGIYYGIQSKYDSSIYYYKMAADLSEAMGHKKSLSSDYVNLSIGYLMQSNFPKALYYQQKSLTLAEENEDMKTQANILINIGCTYNDLGDTTKAEKHFLRAIEISEPREYKKELLYAYTNLASLYHTEKRWEKTYSAAMKADSMANEIGDISIRAASLSKAVLALTEMMDYDRAETVGLLSVKMADQAGQTLSRYQAYTALGKVYIAKEKYSEAIPIMEKGISLIANSQTYTQPLAVAYSQLSLCYEKTGRYQEALENYKMYSQIVDSVRKDENIRKATELSMTYDFDKEKALSEAAQIKLDAKTKTRQLMLSGGLLLTLIIAGGGWISYRRKTRVNSLLKAEKEKVENTLTELKNTQSLLIQSEKMASLGELTAGIAHEIQNPLNFVNNFSDINQELLDELEEEEAKPAGEKDSELIAELIAGIKQNTKKINHHGRRADGIVKGMLQHSRKHSDEKEPTDINKMADEYVRLAYHGYRAKERDFNAKIETDFDGNIEKINAVPQDLGRVMLNLLTNAFYAVNQKKQQGVDGYEPTVKVLTKKLTNQIEITIQDNGMGIPDEVVNKIFQPFFTTKPTGQGTGLGLSLSYDIITKIHGGELNVESEPGEGTRFIIRLPK